METPDEHKAPLLPIHNKFDDSDARKQFDKMVGRAEQKFEYLMRPDQPHRNGKVKIPPSWKRRTLFKKPLARGKSVKATIDDGKLVVAIARRLSNAEKQIKKLLKTIATRDKEILRKEKENKKLQKKIENLDTQAPQDIMDELVELRVENERMDKQILEMETFLKDYGLSWAGFRAVQDEEAEKVEELKKERDMNKIFFNVDEFLEKLRNLSAIVGTHRIQNINKNVHKFIGPDELSLIIHKNGLFIKNGPLRSYDLPECRSFIADVLDGYFPSELKQEFPKGVRFVTVDRRNIDCPVGKACSKNSQVGQVDIKRLKKNLPECVIKKGRVISVKKAIFKNVANSTPLSLIKRSDEKEDFVTDSNYTELKIRFPDSQIVELKFPYTTKMREVYARLKSERSYPSGEAKLMSFFPRRIYECDDETLADLGLTGKKETLVLSRLKETN